MAGTGVDPFSIGLSALQTGFGLFQSITGASKVNNLEKQRQSYKTPDQINQILQLALQQSGGDTQTRDFQTNQLDRAFSSQLGTSEKLGADPNDLSALFDQRVNGIMKIGEQFHASNLEAMGRIYNALNLKADNVAAEEKSKDDLLKDRIAAVGGQVQAGYQNVSGGLNTALAAIQASKASNLYTPPKTT